VRNNLHLNLFCQPTCRIDNQIVPAQKEILTENAQIFTTEDNKQIVTEK